MRSEITLEFNEPESRLEAALRAALTETQLTKVRTEWDKEYGEAEAGLWRARFVRADDLAADADTLSLPVTSENGHYLGVFRCRPMDASMRYFHFRFTPDDGVRLARGDEAKLVESMRRQIVGAYRAARDQQWETVAQTQQAVVRGWRLIPADPDALPAQRNMIFRFTMNDPDTGAPVEVRYWKAATNEVRYLLGG
jgi:hypothetical protein